MLLGEAVLGVKSGTRKQKCPAWKKRKGKESLVLEKLAMEKIQVQYDCFLSVSCFPAAS